MHHKLGPYILDEDARELVLGGAPVSMQPLVLDFLVYLVRNAGRVVPKDELMDVLWPDVTVTEASLQRVVSLARRALKPGGMNKTIRSYVRHGYRFAIDGGKEEIAESSPAVTGQAQAIALAERRAWAAAAQLFERLQTENQLDATGLDVWAMAAESGGRPAEAIPVLIQAVAAHQKAGRLHIAARHAVTLAKLELERSAPSACAGWMDRAETLLQAADEPTSRSYFLWMKSRLASFGGRAEEALMLATEAHATAIASNDQGLMALTLTYRGFFKIALGSTSEGAGEQNHAAAIALSSGVEPNIGSLIYCNILWACRTYPDWTRARQWSRGFETWCKANYAEVPGNCDLHRAEVLGSQSDLSGALDAINDALPKLSEEEAWSIGDGYRVRGDILAMIGDLEAARADYAAAYAMGWDAEPGNAMLLAEEGAVDAALMALDRALAGVTWFHLQRRGFLMAHKARVAAFGGRADIARDAIAELETTPAQGEQTAIRALICEARFHLEEEAGADALRHLVLSRQLWTSAGIEYHAARVRLILAELLIDLGDSSGADAESSAAEATARRIGSRRLAEKARALGERLAASRVVPARE